MIELPPLPSLPSRSFADHERYIIQLRDATKARERILQARIAELEAALSSVRHRLECTPTHMASDIAKIVDAAR